MMCDIVHGLKVAKELGVTSGKARVMYDVGSPFHDEWDRAGRPEYLQHEGEFFQVTSHIALPGCFLEQLFPYGVTQ